MSQEPLEPADPILIPVDESIPSFSEKVVAAVGFLFSYACFDRLGHATGESIFIAVPILGVLMCAGFLVGVLAIGRLGIFRVSTMAASLFLVTSVLLRILFGW